MKKNYRLILFALLIPMFCTAQERIISDVIIDGSFYYDIDHFNIDSLVIDTSLIIVGSTTSDKNSLSIEIHGVTYTGYWHENYPVIQRTPKGEVITNIQTTDENRLYENQNKRAMKKFEYKKEYYREIDLMEALKREGSFGWELVGIINKPFDDEDIYIFKREIQEP